MSVNHCISAAGLTLAATVSILAITGCGTPGAPQPPSLRLPEPVADLTTTRAGNTVTLHWTMPKRTTDRLLLSTVTKGQVPVRVWRREPGAGVMQQAGDVAFGPAAKGEFTDTLPAALSSGTARPLIYYVELANKPGPSGHSAGFSNPAFAVGGAPPDPITNLSAETHADGVALSWDGGKTTEMVEIRLHRRLLTPQTKPKKSDSALMSTPVEPEVRDLLVEIPTGRPLRTLDASAQFGMSYEYTAQRVQTITIADKKLELAGELSSPVKIAVEDTFPPAIPIGLAAVAVPDEKSIDLSWQPDIEPDLAGYIVYRIQVGEVENGKADWIRISGAQPVTSPAYRDTTVQPGNAYRYAVSAIDHTGHESKRSTESQESIRNP